MAKSSPETIVLKGRPIYKEGITDEALSPGHLIERGGTQDVQKNTTADRQQNILVAVENENIGCGIEDAYAANDTVIFVAPSSGDEVLLRIAAGENITKNSYLSAHASSGNVEDAGATQANACAIALEAVNNSTGTTETFIRAEIV